MNTLLAKRIALAKHIGKMDTYSEKISTRSLCHNSVPVWRSRALKSVIFLSDHINMLSDNQLTLIIRMIDKFLVSYNNSNTGYYEHWLTIQAEFKERLEWLQEGNNDIGVNEEDTMGKFWLVSVAGHDYYYLPPHETVSVAIELPDGETPIDWFLNKPEVYYRFEFIPHTLLNFWEITPKQFKAFDANRDHNLDDDCDCEKDES